MTRINSSQIKALKKKVNVQSSANAVKSAPKAKRTSNKETNHIKSVLKEYGIQFEEEKGFSEIRRWRFDLYSHGLKLAIEYEGIVSTQSRHTNITGYTNDTTKYNNAACKGIHVFRFTALNYKNIECDLLRFFYFHGIVKNNLK